MSKTERIKEELGWLKLVFGILVAIDVSLIAWLAQSFNAATRILLAVSWTAVLFVTIALAWVNRAAQRRFRELEDE